MQPPGAGRLTARAFARLGLMVAIVMPGFPDMAAAGECSATSSTRRVPVLELYTSEGCDSCPPADRWVTGLPARGLTSDRVVTLAFHVDYWNHLGWTDPYARAEFSDRQRVAARRSGAGFVYTPQLLLNGKDYRRGLLRDDIPERVAAINREQPAATIRLVRKESGEESISASGQATAAHSGHRPGALAWLALYQNKLATQVLRGENRGRRLEHDFVVRELAGPYAIDAQGIAHLTHEFRTDRSWKRDTLHLAAFVQEPESGEVLQALVLGRCPN
ncbi:MAG TPA: DUF1223 domain-containing protein [Burkholderiales bacterium]|nr:DUF1223 domain-containing protein [Burkholderiales bacterium]